MCNKLNAFVSVRCYFLPIVPTADLSSLNSFFFQKSSLNSIRFFLSQSNQIYWNFFLVHLFPSSHHFGLNFGWIGIKSGIKCILDVLRRKNSRKNVKKKNLRKMSWKKTPKKRKFNTNSGALLFASKQLS